MRPARAVPTRLLPPALRRQVRAARASNPWDAGFDHGRQPCPPGLVTGPPDFVGIGAQKAGTSWWFDLLSGHPQIYHHGAYDKERHFLAKRGMGDGEVPADLAADYASWFPRPAGALIGEWTPAYLYYYWVAALLREVAPDARLLVLLRDPVERYRSALVHRVGVEGVKTASQVQMAYDRGFYAAQLARFAALFPPEQLLVLQYERCRAQPAAELARTFRFLGVDDGYLPAGLDRAHTENDKRPMSERRVRLLRSAYAADTAALMAAYPGLDPTLWPSTEAGAKPR